VVKIFEDASLTRRGFGHDRVSHGHQLRPELIDQVEHGLAVVVPEYSVLVLDDGQVTSVEVPGRRPHTHRAAGIELHANVAEPGDGRATVDHPDDIDYEVGSDTSQV
jgi:hypothetical protein